MKELLINIGWESVECLLCHSETKARPIFVKNKPLVNGQFGYAVHPVICQCGLVYLSPRWSKKDYDIFYQQYYDELYRLEIKPDYGKSGVIAHMETIWLRIKNIVREINVNNILDIGCGFGYGLKYLQKQLPNTQLFGIEASKDCCQKIQSKEIGATLISSDFDSEWVINYKNSMDLIILRHVVQHMLNPVETLSKIRETLTSNGLIYISTLNMMCPRVKLRDYKNWWEYYYRIPHTYYFSKETLFKVLEKANLYPLIYEKNDAEEVWCLATTDKSKQACISDSNIYEKQIKILKRYLGPQEA